MIDLNQIKNFPLKLVFIVHFVLMAWGLQGGWSNESYLFYNLIFFVTLFWGMYANESDEPIQLAIILNCLCIVLDVITLVALFPTRGFGGRFSAAMAILNLIVRPFTSIILYRIMQERNGTLGTTNVFGGPRSYEDIDRPVVHSVPQTDGSQTGSFDFPVTGSAFGQTNKQMPPPYNG